MKLHDIKPGIPQYQQAIARGWKDNTYTNTTFDLRYDSKMDCYWYRFKDRTPRLAGDDWIKLGAFDIQNFTERGNKIPNAPMADVEII